MLTKTEVIFESARFLSLQHRNKSDSLPRTKRFIAAFTLLCDRFPEDEPQECLLQIASYIDEVFDERTTTERHSSSALAPRQHSGAKLK
ncbi:MAG: hypothetical protein CLLPBCKN_006937 [Chroococcidiopsis cubana SAG 39.79]|uniref:hypothetical protein n=1 Tax=Chroococcidiopsis cubana TaxID=171392 RepID=UPI000F8E8A81|nr:hypothetical protein [Chroococcidiopsis cubana]MDZ4877502.1 hypothetical protein [Chroococcidiopsis cubana SAG 39.79]